MRNMKLLTLGLLLNLLASAAQGDSLKLSGFWYDGITIQAFHNGRVIYRNARGQEISQELIKLQAIKISNLPQVQQGVAALNAHDFRAATQALTAALRQAQPDWLKQYLNWHLAKAYNQLGQGPEAVRAYLTLIQSQADPFFWENPPIQSVAQASPRQKQKILALLKSVRQRADPAATAMLDVLSQVAAPDSGITLEHAPSQTASESADAVTLPRKVLRTNRIAGLLRAGQFEKARDQARSQLDQPGKLAQKLYLHGRAVLALAQQRDDLALYKTAGLSFARVIIYFPNSDLAGPALLELGYVHEKIGQPDKAHELYQRAAVGIDPEYDPAYHQRMTQIMALPGKPEARNLKPSAR